MATIIIGIIVAFLIYRGIKATVKHDTCAGCSAAKNCASKGNCSSRQ